MRYSGLGTPGIFRDYCKIGHSRESLEDTLRVGHSGDTLGWAQGICRALQGFLGVFEFGHSKHFVEILWTHISRILWVALQGLSGGFLKLCTLAILGYCEGGRRVGGGWEEGGRRVGGGWEEGGRRVGGGWEEGGRRVGGGWGKGGGRVGEGWEKGGRRVGEGWEKRGRRVGEGWEKGGKGGRRVGGKGNIWERGVPWAHFVGS